MSGPRLCQQRYVCCVDMQCVTPQQKQTCVACCASHKGWGRAAAHNVEAGQQRAVLTDLLRLQAKFIASYVMSAAVQVWEASQSRQEPKA
jgi:hypothetical protein